jgi:hypothetical protein
VRVQEARDTLLYVQVPADAVSGVIVVRKHGGPNAPQAASGDTLFIGVRRQ